MPLEGIHAPHALGDCIRMFQIHDWRHLVTLVSYRIPDGVVCSGSRLSPAHHSSPSSPALLWELNFSRVSHGHLCPLPSNKVWWMELSDRRMKTDCDNPDLFLVKSPAAVVSLLWKSLLNSKSIIFSPGLWYSRSIFIVLAPGKEELHCQFLHYSFWLLNTAMPLQGVPL